LVAASVTVALPDPEAGVFRGVIRQVLPDASKVPVSSGVFTGGPLVWSLPTGPIVDPPTPGDSATLEISVIDPLGREGTALSVTSPPI
jgi:hypothetical protein